MFGNGMPCRGMMDGEFLIWKKCAKTTMIDVSDLLYFIRKYELPQAHWYTYLEKVVFFPH